MQRSNSMERIIFGDNQFVGVNHMSEGKGRAQALKFQDTKTIIDILDFVYDQGVRTLMCTAHDRIAPVCDHFRASPERYADLTLYACMPYAHTYADAITELGMLGTLRRFLPPNMFGTLATAGRAIMSRDIVNLMKLLVDAEMKMFSGLKIGAIFLQNIATDLLLGLGIKEAFIVFSEYSRKKYRAEPGFITMNLPSLVALLDECEIEDPIVCSAINKIGFRMCGGREAYEKVIEERKFRLIAMSVLASGALAPEEALEYVCRQKGIRSIVFGASTRSHIKQTKELIEQFS